MIEVKENQDVDELLLKKRVKRKMSKMEQTEIRERVLAMSKDELVHAIKFFPIEVIQNEITRRMQKSKALNEKIKQLYEEAQTI